MRQHVFLRVVVEQNLALLKGRSGGVRGGLQLDRVGRLHPGGACRSDQWREIKRGVCAAGHKAFYSEEWDGLPDKEFLSLLDPKLANLRDHLYEKAYDATAAAGQLCREWAQKLGLPEGIPVAIGEFDVHYGAIGSGVDEGVFVKAIGTSTCDCCVVQADKPIADIPGICGIVKGAILPGYYGIEAGQSAVGDLFKWWVEGVCEGPGALHAELTKEVAEQRPGQSGLLARCLGRHYQVRRPFRRDERTHTHQRRADTVATLGQNS